MPSTLDGTTIHASPDSRVFDFWALFKDPGWFERRRIYRSTLRPMQRLSLGHGEPDFAGTLPEKAMLRPPMNQGPTACAPRPPALTIPLLAVLLLSALKTSRGWSIAAVQDVTDVTPHRSLRQTRLNISKAVVC
ncbi:hypothetical protein ColTof4_14372 [Colletotrichum tofieldiae]|nr:hypothetical protein ColTof3_14782 [Colletotrichum tofieldiae]GKT81949.1 hypothetical protein ColTof4_14372 [Colletotrichum tofieldiae]